MVDSRYVGTISDGKAYATKDYVDAAPPAVAGYGEWCMDSTGIATGFPCATNSPGGSAGPNTAIFATTLQTPVGISQSNTGVFTISNAGYWSVSVEVDLKLEGVSMNSNWRYDGVIESIDAATVFGKDVLTLSANGYAGSTIHTGAKYFAANAQFRFRPYVYTGFGSGTVYPVSIGRTFVRAIRQRKAS